ncbi:MAG: hypothetical protein ACOCUI_00855 [bacterium]
MKKYFISITLMILISLFVLNSYLIRSIVVMGPYNMINLKSSFINEENIEIDIPKEEKLDWYPILNIFNAKYFRNYIMKDVDLVVYYTFGSFKNKYSDIFRKSSPTYSSFYGAYVTRNNSEKDFIFEDSGNLILKDIKDILLYDYIYLVLKPLGYNKDVDIDFEIIEQKESKGRITVLTEIKMNGLAHSYKGFNRNYLQYGTPEKYVDGEFNKIQTYGKFIIEKKKDDINIIYYIINKDLSIVKGWDI